MKKQYSKQQEREMLSKLGEFFSVISRIDNHHKISVEFPERTVQDHTTLRIGIRTPHTKELEMISLHAYQIKGIKKITGLKLKSVNAFVYSKEFTELVAMFE